MGRSRRTATATRLTTAPSTEPGTKTRSSGSPAIIPARMNQRAEATDRPSARARIIAARWSPNARRRAATTPRTRLARKARTRAAVPACASAPKPGQCPHEGPDHGPRNQPRKDKETPAPSVCTRLAGQELQRPEQQKDQRRRQMQRGQPGVVQIAQVAARAAPDMHQPRQRIPEQWQAQQIQRSDREKSVHRKGTNEKAPPERGFRCFRQRSRCSSSSIDFFASP